MHGGCQCAEEARRVQCWQTAKISVSAPWPACVGTLGRAPERSDRVMCCRAFARPVALGQPCLKLGQRACVCPRFYVSHHVTVDGQQDAAEDKGVAAWPTAALEATRPFYHRVLIEEACMCMLAASKPRQADGLGRADSWRGSWAHGQQRTVG